MSSIARDVQANARRPVRAGGHVASGEQRTNRAVGDPRRVTMRRDLISTAWRLLARERRSVVGLGALAVFAAQVESAALVLIALIADAVSRGEKDVAGTLGPVDLSVPIAQAGMAGLIAIGVAALLVFTNGRLTAHVMARLERQDRERIAHTYATADWEYQATQSSSRIQGQLRLMSARSRVFAGFVGWMRGVASISVFVIVAAAMSAVAALTIVGFGIVLSLAVLPIRLSARRLARRTAETELGLTDEFVDAIDQGADVHVFAAWPTILRRFENRSRTLQTLRERTGTLQNLLPVVYQYGALALIMIIVIAASLTQSTSGFGSFAATALLLLRSVQYGQTLQQSLYRIAAAAPSVDALERELNVPLPRTVPGDQVLDRIDLVELRDVEYTYPGASESTLTGVNLEIRPGRIVGLAGPSGSGKSTLAQILLRLRWPTAGRCTVNGRDASVYTADSWARMVAHLPQRPQLLHGSLSENVTYFNMDITTDQAAAALRAVGLSELLSTLPDGMETQVGSTARNLSGGQVQRLGIARALAREPGLVVLDEPTSALDTNSERLVGEALEALRGRPNMIIVVIAHRASTLALCDEIVVLDNGRVAAAGRADSLDNEFLAATWATSKPRATEPLPDAI